MKKYRLDGSRVLFEGKPRVELGTVCEAIYRAMRKKSRHKIDGIFDRAALYGEATLRWNFTYKITAADNHWVQMHVRRVQEYEYTLFCSGPRAQDVIDKLNGRTVFAAPKQQKRPKPAKRLRGRRQEEKRKKLQAKWRDNAIQPKKQKRRRQHPLPQHQVDLTPQFRKHTLLWDEALDEVVKIFGIRRDEKHTAREIAARRLYRSLERNEYRFAQYRSERFCLHLNLQGAWLLDTSTLRNHTKIKISCTKNNRHRLYRRLRKRLRKRFYGPPPKLRWPCLQLVS